MTDYTRYSYEDLVQRITTKLQNEPGWGDAYETSMGQSLIRMVSDVTDYLHYMLERRTIERYMISAITQSAVFSRASELGYRAKRVRANYGSVTVNLVDNQGSPVTAIARISIPKYTEFTLDEQVVVSTEDAFIPIGGSSVTIPVKNGTYGSIVFPNADFVDDHYVLIEDYINIENGSLTISSNNEEFADVTVNQDGLPARRAMSFVDADERFYDIRYTTDGMRILLGDGTFGKEPAGDLLVEYILTEDISQPINTIGNVFTTSFSFVDELGNTYTTLIENDEKIFRGREPESIQEIKTNAIAYNKTNGRAVTISDVDFWVKESEVAGITDARSMGERELDTVVYNLNNVYINYLKEDGTELTVAEENELREYMSEVLMTTVHPVFRQADNLLVQTLVEVRKEKSLEMSNAEFYSIVKTFFDDYFKLQEGSIGREIQHSEVVRDLHAQTVTRNNIVYPLIDYVKLDMNAVFPFSVPVKINNALVNIDEAYTPTTGDDFILVLQNIPCVAPVTTGETFDEILQNMRDQILANTPFVAKVQLSNYLVDAGGNPLPIPIDNKIGRGILIGTDTPYDSPTTLINPPAVGATIAAVELQPTAVVVQHFYYSSIAGRRPLIPLRDGTEITFTAPTDTDVNVYMRTDMHDPGTEVLLTTVLAGNAYNTVYNSGEHSIQFEYVNNSAEDVIVGIDYPGSAEEEDLGLKIETRDSFGEFTLLTSSGDLSAVVTVDYNVTVPPTSRTRTLVESEIYPSSLKITNTSGVTIYNTNEDGRFVDTSGNLVATGSVNYNKGVITVPTSLANGNYRFVYKQNKFQNFKTDQTAALVLSPISTDPDNPAVFSKITVV